MPDCTRLGKSWVLSSGVANGESEQNSYTAGCGAFLFVLATSVLYAGFLLIYRVEGWHNVFPTVVSLLLDEVPMGGDIRYGFTPSQGRAINWHATFGDGSLFRTAMPHGVGLIPLLLACCIIHTTFSLSVTYGVRLLVMRFGLNGDPHCVQ